MNFEGIKMAAFVDEMEKIGLSLDTLASAGAKAKMGRSAFGDAYKSLEGRLYKQLIKTPKGSRGDVMYDLLRRRDAAAIRNAGRSVKGFGPDVALKQREDKATKYNFDKKLYQGLSIFPPNWK